MTESTFADGGMQIQINSFGENRNRYVSAVFGWQCHKHLAGQKGLLDCACCHKSFQSVVFSRQGCGHSVALSSVTVSQAKMHKGGSHEIPSLGSIGLTLCSS